MPPQCLPIPPHPGQEAGSALPAPHLPQATTGMPQPPAELRKHFCPRATIFMEVLNPPEGTGNGRLLAQSKGHSPKQAAFLH